MANPFPRVYQVLSVGDDDLSRAGLQNGPSINEISRPEPPFNDMHLNGVKVGTWGVVPLIFTFQNQVVTQLKLSLHWYLARNPNNQEEPFFQSDGDDPPSSEEWDFRVRCLSHWQNPNTISASEINNWTIVPRGQAVEGYHLNLDIPAGPSGGNRTNTGIDTIYTVDNRNLLVAHDSLVDTWVFNAYTYIAIKPRIGALGGLYTNWHYRLYYVFPDD